MGIAIGSYILDLAYLECHGFFSDCLDENYTRATQAEVPFSRTSIFSQSTLNVFASIPSTIRTAVRSKIIRLLQDKSSTLFADPRFNDAAFYCQKKCTMHLPMHVGDFSDFMCARTHVDNVSLHIVSNKSSPTCAF
ncbi:MAG: hypothetical protein CL912_26295 [Deltaproteobacteria bacterium]|nr:hypothetical protein [Deltaproteobacteria bacterium]